ncbi:Copine-domain-containing protein [Gigaspora rosea]|uniref:Copine-domain-containing protein n=1 Tax=Gigaspora rosea TaxID=44941 RepID=A0A397UCN9_9GLOM|nr:Copine-domain-containing protein [Gigaspora rosea]
MSVVELRIAVKNIPTLDILSQSDPQVFLFLQKSYGIWDENPHCKTEIVKNNSNPKFTTPLIMDYHFEELQRIKLIVVDVDKFDNPRWQAQEYVGEFITDIGSILGKQKGIMQGSLTRRVGEKRGEIIIAAREVRNENSKNYKFHISGYNIPISSFITKEKTYYEIVRIIEDSEFSVHRSTSSSSKNPEWEPMYLSENDLWNNVNDNVKIGFKYFKDGRKNPKLLCNKIWSIDDFIKNSGTLQRIVFEKHGEIRLSYKKEKTFLDYIEGGLEIQLSIAVDFTASNLDREIDLHGINSNNSEYERAMHLVGTILEKYDSDDHIPVYGFGGKFYGNSIVSHNCLLTSDESSHATGISRAIDIYKHSLQNVNLSGPTNFSPIIQTISNNLKKLVSMQKNVYAILLIITDGIISDLNNTIEAIMNATTYPLSIIIVGVGHANFSNMTLLADELLSRKWDDNLHPRDIVHFVRINDFIRDKINVDLPRAVLKEIPGQIMEYMKIHNIEPKRLKKPDIYNELFSSSPPPYISENNS